MSGFAIEDISRHLKRLAEVLARLGDGRAVDARLAALAVDPESSAELRDYLIVADLASAVGETDLGVRFSGLYLAGVDRPNEVRHASRRVRDLLFLAGEQASDAAVTALRHRAATGEPLIPNLGQCLASILTRANALARNAALPDDILALLSMGDEQRHDAIQAVAGAHAAGRVYHDDANVLELLGFSMTGIVS